MGLYRTDYIVYGWKLPILMTDKDGNKIDFWDDKFLPYIEGHKGVDFTIVRDFDKKHLVFGKLIGINSDGWDYQNIDVTKLNAKEVQDKYKEVFELEDDVLAEPYLFIFSHWN
jgi:hypothetical protein